MNIFSVWIGEIYPLHWLGTVLWPTGQEPGHICVLRQQLEVRTEGATLQLCALWPLYPLRNLVVNQHIRDCMQLSLKNTKNYTGFLNYNAKVRQMNTNFSLTIICGLDIHVTGPCYRWDRTIRFLWWFQKSGWKESMTVRFHIIARLQQLLNWDSE